MGQADDDSKSQSMKPNITVQTVENATEFLKCMQKYIIIKLVDVNKTIDSHFK